jgi:hypothetical protein
MPFPISIPSLPSIITAIGETAGAVFSKIGTVVSGAASAVLIGLATPVPAGSDCEREWEDALQQCSIWINSPNPPTGLTGGYTDVYSCAKGLVSERCGGNPIDHGKRPGKNPKPRKKRK